MSDSQASQDTRPSADWDMTPYFSAHGAGDYQDFRAQLDRDIDTLASSLAEAGAIDESSTDSWAEMLVSLEDITNRASHLGSYLGCLSSADATDEAIKKDTAQLASTGAQLDKLYVLTRAALGDCDGATFEALLGSDKLGGSSYFLSRLREQAKKSMSAELESLSAELGVDGLSAWGRLYDQVSGNLEFDLEVMGKESARHPISMTRTLLEDSDPQIRKAAFDGSAKAWDSASDSVAACLNAISGTRLTLYKRRGIEHFLEPALFDAGIERETLDCMLDTVRSRQSIPQRYLKEKAKLLGMDTLRFCDLMAPLPSGEGEEARIPWDEGQARIQAAFDDAYPDLGAMTRTAFDQRWIDHSPRPGKRPGGFCSSSQITQQSRIFMTYNGAMGDVQTLAHELGHTFHSYLMREMRPWAVEYPMTLAETASTFAENLVTNAALKNPATSAGEKRRILDQRLQDASAFLLNIPMRFDFEKAVYEQRANGELSVSQFKELMLEAQRTNYGDSLDTGELDPWFWASKLHFYITEVSFYNFPYTFGYLFSLGIFARFLKEGASFIPRYEELLRQTGSAPAEQVAMDALGVDLKKPDFWNASIDLVEQDLSSFVSLGDN